MSCIPAIPGIAPLFALSAAAVAAPVRLDVSADAAGFDVQPSNATTTMSMPRMALRREEIMIWTPECGSRHSSCSDISSPIIDEHARGESMQAMMNCCGGMWVQGIIGILLIILLVVVIAKLLKK
jgi:hypothetical protein